MAPVLRLRGAREIPLFSCHPGDIAAFGETIVDGDGALTLVRGWLARERADRLLAEIRRSSTWLRERRVMYDRTVAVPREQAWVGAGCERSLWPDLASIRDDLEALSGTSFPFVLFNRYRDGSDSVAWHSDRPIPGTAEPAIVASLTLGATRAFDVRAKRARSRVVSVDLEHGDLVLMGAGAQERFEHRVPKVRRAPGERINLTFRQNSRCTVGIEQEFERPSPIE